jgi:hypothetical protein
MKKIFVLLFGLVAAVPAFANTVACSGSAGNGVVITGAAANFVRIDVLPKCSANVLLNWEQTANGFATAAASTKGKQMFSGNTGGGAVTSQGVCTNSLCTVGQLAAPLAAALAAAT